jgi:hypothetical protein
VTPRGAARLLDIAWIGQDIVGRHLAPPDPGAADPARPAAFVTSVVRAPPEHAHDLAALAAELTAGDGGQYCYPAGSIHVTLAPVTEPTADAGAVSAALAAAARRLGDPPLTVEIVGLVLTRGSLAALGLPGDDRLARERAALRPVLGPPRGSWQRFVRADGLMHLTIARWRRRPAPEVVAAIRERRVLTLPARPLAAIELVRTNKVMSATNTVVLARYPLVPQLKFPGQG